MPLYGFLYISIFSFCFLNELTTEYMYTYNTCVRTYCTCVHLPTRTCYKGVDARSARFLLSVLFGIPDAFPVQCLALAFRACRTSAAVGGCAVSALSAAVQSALEGDYAVCRMQWEVVVQGEVQRALAGKCSSFYILSKRYLDTNAGCRLLGRVDTCCVRKHEERIASWEIGLNS